VFGSYIVFVMEQPETGNHKAIQVLMEAKGRNYFFVLEMLYLFALIVLTP